MKKILIGVVITLLVQGLAGFGVMKLGLFPVNADAVPSSLEKEIAEIALFSAVERNAPKGPSPFKADETTLREGMEEYKEHCGFCHGQAQATDYGKNFYPPAPQFGLKTPGEPENELFYIAKHGIRLSGMPAFGAEGRAVMPDEEIWKIIGFIKNMKSLPPALQAEWTAPPGLK